MFFHLQYIHLFRPFLKYAPTASPLPSHVSPRRICTANAGAISKLMRLYKKSWNLRQICNIAVYMTHSACTIHLLNLPEKTAKRDITHGVKHLEEIAEDWLCARRTLSILSVLARKWNCDLPEDAAAVLQRADEKFGYYTTSEVPSPRSSTGHSIAGGSDDMGPSAMHQELSQNSAYILSHMSSQQGSIDGRLEMSPQTAIRTGLTPGGPHPSHSNTISVASSPMAAGFSPGRAWNQSPVPTNHGTPNYGGMGMPIPSAIPPNPHAPVPADIAAKGDIDTSQWLLTDSAQWQRNFEGWDLNTPGAGPSNGFVFGSSPVPAATNIPPNMQHQGMQGHGVHQSQYPRTAGMEEYDASLNWLPRLQ